MKYFNLKTICLMIICTLTVYNSLTMAVAAEEAFTLLGATTLAPVKNTNPNIYVIVNSTQDTVIMRSNSKSSANSVTELPNEYSLSVLGAEYGWIYVEDDNNNKGYIEAEHLTFMNGQKPDNSRLFPEEKEVTPDKGIEIVEYAKKFIGTPYVWGGTNLKTGVDCSGLIYSVYRDFGISLSRSSSAMYSNNGTSVAKSELKSGDLVFFNTSGRGVSHVGMYVGNGQYIHSSNGGVAIADLYSNYSVRTYVGAKRIIA